MSLARLLPIVAGNGRWGGWLLAHRRPETRWALDWGQSCPIRRCRDGDRSGHHVARSRPRGRSRRGRPLLGRGLRQSHVGQRMKPAALLSCCTYECTQAYAVGRPISRLGVGACLSARNCSLDGSGHGPCGLEGWWPLLGERLDGRISRL